MEIKEKKQMSEETKAKLVYSGELIIISIVFLVFGILRLTGLMGYDHNRRLIFNIVTTLGGCYGLYNLISYIVSKKKRAKTSLVDIVTSTPLFFFILFVDIYCWIKVAGLKVEEVSESFKTFYRFAIGGAFTYAFLVYCFQGIYHYFKPIPMLIQALEEERKQKELEALEAENASNAAIENENNKDGKEE